jgi:hypothetical protein
VDGGAMAVPTLDHVHVTPTGNRVFVFFDDGKWDDIRLTVDQNVAES